MLHPPAGGLVGLASVTVRVFAASYLLNTYGVNVSQVRLGVTATATGGLLAAFLCCSFCVFGHIIYLCTCMPCAAGLAPFPPTFR